MHTTGSYITSSYTDDIYFNPGVFRRLFQWKERGPENAVAEKSAHRMIISDIQQNEEGAQTMSNYILMAPKEMLMRWFTAWISMICMTATQLFIITMTM